MTKPEDTLMTWVNMLPAAGWRGTVPELAAILECTKAKLAEALEAKRADVAAAGWVMEFVQYPAGRRVEFSRPPVRRVKPSAVPDANHTPAKSTSKKKRKPSDTGVTLP